MALARPKPLAKHRSRLDKHEPATFQIDAAKMDGGQVAAAAVGGVLATGAAGCGRGDR